MTHEALQVLYIEPDALLADPDNAREHSDEQIAQIVHSIREFGFNDPIQIDEHGKVLAGHGTLRAAKYIGLSHVPCTPLTHLTEAQKVGYSLAHNRIPLNSTWNEAKLGQALRAVRASDFGRALGFDASELKTFTSDALRPVEEGTQRQATPTPERTSPATANSQQQPQARDFLRRMVETMDEWARRPGDDADDSAVLAKLFDLAQEARAVI